ncbi:MAG: PAS domain-containing protein, partial [Deferrisomatales bacterium]
MTSPALRTAVAAQLFDLVRDPVFAVDAEARFLDLNAAAGRYLGRAPEELLGRSLAEVFRPEQVDLQLQAIRQVLATGEPFVQERPTAIGDQTYLFQYVLCRLEGAPGTPAAAVGMVRDVTGLAALERRYAELYERATDALFGVDTTGRIRVLNREAEEMSGYSRETLETLHFSDLVAPDEIARMQEYFARRVQGQDAPTHYEVRYRHASGEDRWAEVHISREASSLGAFQASVRDVTGRKLLDEARR